MGRHAATVPVMLMAALLTSPVAASPVSDPPVQSQLVGTATGPDSTLLNINNFHLWVDKRGMFPQISTMLGSWAGEYPPGFGAIRTEGFLWGAKVRDGVDKLVRVGGSTYVTGLKAGKVVYNEFGRVTGSEDPETRHVWRVRADYRTADLSPDAASYYNIETDHVSDAQMQAIRDAHIQAIYDQYDHDWHHWPAAEGAPFDDLNADGVYDPSIDVPGIPGAQQTIWLVANDLPQAEGTHVSQVIAGAPPIGVEVQMTLYAASSPSLEPLNNMVFKHVRLIYTGLPDTPDSAHIDTMYFTQWSDPDLGDYGDDLVGFDRNLDMGYVYNGVSPDVVYQAAGYQPPAVGHVLLEGPTFAGDTLEISSFIGGASLFYTDIGVYAGSLQSFNLMEGFLPRPPYPDQVPFVYDSFSKFMLDGDPVAGTGFLDGLDLPPGDRRYWMSTGPFSMALGDTQEVTLALVGGLGADRLGSISVLRHYAVWAQVFHRWGLPPLEIAHEDAESLPTTFALSQNYPNPFNPTTHIDYDVPIQSFLTLAVYNLLGQEIIRLVDNRDHPPGNFSVVWTGHSWRGVLMPAGVYLYRLEARPPYVLPGQGFVKTGKMLLLK